MKVTKSISGLSLLIPGDIWKLGFAWQELLLHELFHHWVEMSFTIVIPEDRQNEEREILERGEHIDHFETVRRHKHGTPVVVSLSVSPVDAEGKIVGVSKIARDITEQKRNQEQIATLAREAEHRSKNLLATVHATVMLSQSDIPEGLKKAIEGRIRALANVHSLFGEAATATCSTDPLRNTRDIGGSHCPRTPLA